MKTNKQIRKMLKDVALNKYGFYVHPHKTHKEYQKERFMPEVTIRVKVTR